MKLLKLIGIDRVFLGLEASSVEEALAAVSERLAQVVSVDADTVAAALLERELLGSTSVGDGFAIPHCKLPGLDSIAIAVARFTWALEFKAPDHQPVQLIFVVLSPPGQPAAHLQVLSQIARVLRRKDLRAELLRTPDAASAVAAIKRFAEVEGL